MGLLWRRVLIVLAAAACAALPAQPLVGASYLCHMTGKVSETHCCAGKRAEACHAQVERPDCCELMQGEGHATAPAVRNPQDAPSFALIAAPGLPLPARAGAQQIHEPRPVDAWPPGSPRFLLNCSLLI